VDDASAQPAGSATVTPMTHEHTDLGTGPETDPGLEQPFWCDFDLESIPAAPVCKPESLEWALGVDWELVNTLVREHLDELTATLPGAQLVATAHWAALSPANREGLTSLYDEPPYATTLQISSGGHRIEAMRQQGVRWALGQCYPSDVGNGVPELHAYLPA
jgi:hypothetical protein